ncbi:MAG: immunoglobulin-like domain-containing protein [Pseudomonadota bacterium]
MRITELGPKRLAVTLLVAICLMSPAGCGGGGGDSAAAPSNPAPAPAAADPLYLECMSTVPIDAHNVDQPVITLLGDKVVSHPLGTQYMDAGAYALDPRAGDISNQIQVSGLTGVNTNVVGDYLVRYNVKNGAQLPAAEVVRMVRVTDGAFRKTTARDIGTTSGHMGYYEHLPVNYSADPNQKFPLIIYQHGWFNARFLNSSTVQAPLSILTGGNLVKIINDGRWNDSQPFIVLSPQRCLDPLRFTETAAQTKRFIDYAINTYKVDTSRIYMGGHSQGSGNTWDYVVNYPQQLAAIFPISGGYGSSVGCTLGQTPSWAFIGKLDATVPYMDQVNTVASINACSPPVRAKVTVLDGIGHNDVELPILGLTGSAQGLPQYDRYDQSIYSWLLQYSR